LSVFIFGNLYALSFALFAIQVSEYRKINRRKSYKQVSDPRKKKCIIGSTIAYALLHIFIFWVFTKFCFTWLALKIIIYEAIILVVALVLYLLFKVFVLIRGVAVLGCIFRLCCKKKGERFIGNKYQRLFR
jgi:hypothetical protein